MAIKLYAKEAIKKFYDGGFQDSKDKDLDYSHMYMNTNDIRHNAYSKVSISTLWQRHWYVDIIGALVFSYMYIHEMSIIGLGTCWWANDFLEKKFREYCIRDKYSSSEETEAIIKVNNFIYRLTAGAEDKHIELGKIKNKGILLLEYIASHVRLHTSTVLKDYKENT